MVNMESKNWIVWLVILVFYSIILLALPDWLLAIFPYEREVLMVIWFIVFAIMCIKA